MMYHVQEQIERYKGASKKNVTGLHGSQQLSPQSLDRNGYPAANQTTYKLANPAQTFKTQVVRVNGSCSYSTYNITIFSDLS